jgi:hypothetical protein
MFPYAESASCRREPAWLRFSTHFPCASSSLGPLQFQRTVISLSDNVSTLEDSA